MNYLNCFWFSFFINDKQIIIGYQKLLLPMSVIHRTLKPYPSSHSQSNPKTSSTRPLSRSLLISSDLSTKSINKKALKNLGLIEFYEHVLCALLYWFNVLVQLSEVILGILQHLIQQHVPLIKCLRLTNIFPLPKHYKKRYYKIYMY